MISVENKTLKKILFLGSQIDTGGAQRVLFEQATWFDRHGYEVVVAFLYDKSGELGFYKEKYAFPIINLGFMKFNGSRLGNVFRFLCGSIRFAKLLLMNKFDTIETFTHHSNIIGLPLAWLTGISIRLGSHHGKITDFPKCLDWLHTWIINSGITTKLIAVSKAVEKDAIASRINPEKIEVIPNGIKVPEVEDLDPAYLREELNLTGNNKILLTAGRLTYEKGHEFLLRSLPEILEAFPEVILVIAGDGILRTELESEVQRLNISSQVFFLGFRKDIPQLLASADLFVLSSRSEGLPMVILEAMGIGIPVLSTDVGGIGEVIRDGINGRLVKPESESQLAQAIIEVFKNEPERKKFISAGRELISSGYTVDIMCDNIKKLICSNIK